MSAVAIIDARTGTRARGDIAVLSPCASGWWCWRGWALGAWMTLGLEVVFEEVGPVCRCAEKVELDGL